MHKYKMRKSDIEIDMAPLIDVVFLLLIFFMVASSLNTNEVRATIQLPQSELQSELRRSSLTFYLDKTGKLTIDEHFIPWEGFSGYLKALSEENPQSIEVYADKEVNFEFIAKIIEVANQLNIDQVDFCLKYQQLEQMNHSNQ